MGTNLGGGGRRERYAPPPPPPTRGFHVPLTQTRRPPDPAQAFNLGDAAGEVR